MAADPQYREVLDRMHAALLAICDPQAVDRQAKADQAAMIESYGGAEAAHKMGSTTSTPVTAAQAT